MSVELDTPPAPESRPAAPVARVAPSGVALSASLANALRAVARRRFLLGLAVGILRLALCALALVAAQLALDHFLQFSRPVRITLLAIDAAVLLTFAWRGLIPPFRHRWHPEQAALAIQRHWPSLGSRIISAVQLSGPRPAGTGGTPALVGALVAEASRRVGSLPLALITPARPALRFLGGVLALAVACGLVAWLAPARVQLLLQRFALIEVALPTRTGITPVTTDLFLPAGSRVELVSLATGEIPPGGLLEVVPETGDRRTLPATPVTETPDRFVAVLENVQQTFRYRFRLGDAVSAYFKVVVEPAPIVEYAEFTLTYPAYTGRPPAKLPPGPLTLFAGAALRVEGRSSLPLRHASLALHGTERTLHPLSIDDARLGGDLVLPAENLTGLSLVLESANGVASPSPTVYPVRLETDQPPTLAILSPENETHSLVAGATLPVRARVRDDYGVARVELVYELSGTAAKAGSSRAFRRNLAPDADGVLAFDLAPAEGEPSWNAGTTVTWWLEATDNRQPAPANLGVSDKRQLSLVTLAEKQAEVLTRLDEAARLIDELATKQNEARDQLGEALRTTAPTP